MVTDKQRRIKEDKIMHGLLAFLILISFLVVVYFLVKTLISFIIKNDNHKKYRKCLGISTTFFLLFFIFLCVTNELDNVLWVLGYAWGYSTHSITIVIDALSK